MYRKSLQEKMAAELDTPYQFVNRVGGWPVVATAVGQLGSLYSRTKESNRLMKYTFETAESGAKVVANTALPVVATATAKLEKPICALDILACSQLDKLEKTCPIVTKPTDEVLKETKNLYNATLKPTVDKVSAVKDYGVSKYTGIKEYGMNKVNGVKTSTYNSIDGVKVYGVGKLQTAKDYSQSTMEGLAQTRYGQAAISTVDTFLDLMERYVEWYLPKQEGDCKDEEMDPESEKNASTLVRVSSLSDKVRRRMYFRALREIQHVQRWSKQTIEKLHVSVDVLQFAKTNLDGVQGTMVATQNRFKDIWAEINMADEEIEMKNLAADSEGSEDGGRVQLTTLERRAIATARDLTRKLKRTLAAMSDSTRVLPSTIREKISDAKQRTEDLFTIFSEGVGGVSESMLTRAKESLDILQGTMSSLADYVVGSKALSWLKSVSGFQPLPTGEEPQTQDPSSEHHS